MNAFEEFKKLTKESEDRIKMSFVLDKMKEFLNNMNDEAEPTFNSEAKKHLLSYFGNNEIYRTYEELFRDDYKTILGSEGRRKKFIRIIDFLLFETNVHSLTKDIFTYITSDLFLSDNSSEEDVDDEIFNKNIRHTRMWKKFITYEKDTATKLLEDIAIGELYDNLMCAYESKNADELRRLSKGCNLSYIEDYYRDDEMRKSFDRDLLLLQEKEDLFTNSLKATQLIDYLLHRFNLYYEYGNEDLLSDAKILIDMLIDWKTILPKYSQLLQKLENYDHSFLENLVNLIDILLNTFDRYISIIYKLLKKEYRSKICTYLDNKFRYKPEDMYILEEVFFAPRFRYIYDEEVVKLKPKALKSEVTSVDHLLVKEFPSEDTSNENTKNKGKNVEHLLFRVNLDSFKREKIKILITNYLKDRIKEGDGKIPGNVQATVMKALIELYICDPSVYIKLTKVKLHRIINSFIISKFGEKRTVSRVKFNDSYGEIKTSGIIDHRNDDPNNKVEQDTYKLKVRINKILNPPDKNTSSGNK